MPGASIVYGGITMKLFMAVTAAAAATVLVGAAMGAESDKFVIRGDAAKQLLEQNSINIATAEAIAKACVDEANKEGVKAKTVLNTRQSSKAAMNAVARGGSEARQIQFGNFANSGGLPIVINGNQFIGAIGIGGSAPKVPVWSDEVCGYRALTKVMGPQPPLLPDVPPAAAAGAAG